MDIGQEGGLICCEPYKLDILAEMSTYYEHRKTGKELLLPELPLRLRLIGLRVTKLKDLRLDEDAKPGSLKRVSRSPSPGPAGSHDMHQFFENASSSESPQKKRRVDPSEETLALSQDGYEESMPNFHEDLEVDDDALQEDDGELTNPQEPTSARSTTDPGPSKPPSHAAHHDDEKASSPSLASSTKRPRPQRQSPDLSSDEHLESHTCPVCSKTMQTDNSGLNAHIDFCLSKGAIREAQAMALGDCSENIKPLTRTKKVPSKRAGKRK